MGIKRMEFIDFSPPTFGDTEINEVVDTLKSNWVTTGPKTKLFEDAFKNKVQSEDALALNSCTAGLFLGLKALGVEPGDEVITTPLTFCATANVIEHLGAKVVFADILEDTLLINPEEVKKKISSKTKVILPVHYAGQPAHMDEINALAKENKIKVLEDAAHAFPAEYKGRMIGDTKNLVAYSFYATKNLSTAEGGMLTGPTDMIQQVRSMSLHGMTKDAWKRFDKRGSWEYDVAEPGYKYNMTDIQASLGLSQLKRIDEFDKARKKIVETYDTAFQQIKEISTTVNLDDRKSSYHLYVIRLKLDKLNTDRNNFIAELKEKGIGASVHYKPVHMMTYYKNKYKLSAKDLPITTNSYDGLLSLPLHPLLSHEQANRVINSVIDLVEKYKK